MISALGYKINRVILIIISIALIQPFILSAQEYPNDEYNFFSLQKYGYTYLYFYRFQQLDLRTAGLAQRRVKELAKKFVKGFDALREGKTDKAISQFKQISRVLPEYFHIDFIIALSYEKKGDFKNAARFYKSYLEKLKKFDNGMYRLTQPLIEKTVNFNIPGYEKAEDLIEQRMAKYGINMQKVSLGHYPPLLIIIIIVIMVGALLCLASKADPVKRILYKAKAELSHSKECWICIYCGKENANINTICYNCGKAPK